MNSNIVSLIAKVNGVECIIDFHPIALTNFYFKIITKNLADKFAVIVSRIIFPNQNGFIKGRNVKVCICIIFEAINLLSKKVKGDNVVIKIDITKDFFIP